MNRIVKALAPALLAVAAFGVQASELTPGDIGAQPVRAGAAVALPVFVPAGLNGEITAGDIGGRPVGAPETQRRLAAEPNPVPAYSQFLIVG